MKTVEQLRLVVLAARRKAAKMAGRPCAGQMGHPGVYFVGFNGHIKIGCAANVVSRARAIEYGIPVGDLTRIAWIPVYGSLSPHAAPEDHEKAIHEQFADIRVRGEWFRDTPALRRFIDRYGFPWPTALEE